MHKKFEYKWIIAVGCTLVMAVTHAVVNNSISLFMKPVSDQMGFSRTEFALCNTITALTSMVSSLGWGYLYSKFKPKPLHLISAIGLSLSFFTLSHSRLLIHFYVSSFFLGVFFSGAALLPVSLMINRWFDQYRGLALSIALSGSGVGGIILNPIINQVIFTKGWEDAYQVVAMIILFVSIPVIGLLFKNPSNPSQPVPKPEYSSATSLPKKQEENESLKDLFKISWPYLFLFGATCTSIVSMGCMLNLPSYLYDSGFNPVTVARITSLYSGFLLLGKILLGLIYDRFGSKKGTIFSGVCMLLACILLLLIKNKALVYVMTIFFGLGAAIGTVTPSYLSGKLVPNIHFGVFYSIVQFFLNLGIALGVPMVAKINDIFKSYQPAWILLGFISILMTLSFLYSLNKAKTIFLSKLLHS